MSPINEINKVILIENIACVFRNYSFVNLKTKYLIKICMFLVIGMYLYATTLFWKLAGVVSQISSQDVMNYYSLVLYIMLTTTNTLLAIIIGVCKSKSFKTYIECINAIHQLCNRDSMYHNIAVNRFKRRVYVMATVAAAVALAITTTYSLEIFKFAGQFDISLYAVYSISDISYQYRYIVENFAYCVFLEVVVTRLQYLHISVSAVTHELRNERSLMGHRKLIKLGHDLTTWEVVSCHLSECSRQLLNCFSLQIAVMLFTATVYYILLLYKSICFIKQGQTGSASMSSHCVATLLCEYLLLQLVVVHAGQRACDAADAFYAAVASLRYLLIDIPGPAGVRQALARRAGTLLLRLRATPARARPLRVRTALLVAVLAATVDYTLILLQFNHVV